MSDDRPFDPPHDSDARRILRPRHALDGFPAAGSVGATALGLAATIGAPDRRAGGRAPTLVVIDMQNVFGTPSSEWFTPKFADASAVIQRMLPAFGERVILTRFVAPAQPEGEWVTFYLEWPWALVTESDPIYDLVSPFVESGHPTVTETTFGKWGAGLERAFADSCEVVLTGVATDCCVLSTALAAADAGVRVRVVADGCAGSTDANHQRALDTMAGWAPPLIEITDSESVLANFT